MNLRPRVREETDINLTPLIDVVFLLLIFFMVSTTFSRESAIRVDLPEASAERVAHDDRIIDLTIGADGRYYIDQQLVINTKIETLKKAYQLVLDKAGDEEAVLIINADAKTPHQAVITAMDAARQLGIQRISLATQQK